jgi:predicted  nucleic acid-binding Zn-ribbon protein
MKIKRLNRTVSTAMLTLGAAWLLSGCKSPGYKQADKTGEGIATFREEVVNGQKAIDATMAALSEVAASANTDPRKPYENYCKQVSNLESTAARIRKRAEDMRAKGKAYFDQWKEQLATVKNPEIQQLAKEREAKLSETFDNIKNVTEPLKAQFDPWMSDLKDLQTYLANDLTISGIDAAKNLFAKTQKEGMEVQSSMGKLITELNTLAATITAAKVPPPPPGGTETNAPPAAKK